MNREYHAWHSPRLGRRMELLLFGHSGEPVLMFPTSFGRFTQNEDFGLVGALAQKVRAGRYMIFCVDHIDSESWANRRAHPHDRLLRHEQYESYLLEEVLPLIRQRASPGRLTVTGPSFGGFLAAVVGLRHPWAFQRLLTLSALYETERWLDGYHDQRVYFHSPLQWLPNLADHGRLEHLWRQEIILAVPEHDHAVVMESNRKLSGILWSKGIGNHLSVWNGKRHDWPDWKPMINHYLPW
jgi:esterase/lipase superfamily enzyme